MILADESIDNRIIQILRKHNFSIISVAEEFQGKSDIEIINIARKSNLIILTEDKDFGEWVFAHKESNISIIFLRYFHEDYELIAKNLLHILRNQVDDIAGFFTVITKNKIRKREI